MRLSPFSPYLPKYPGPHQVGTIELELPLPIELQRTFGSCTVKTLLVRLFYPTSATRGHKPRWTGTGHYTLQGYAKFLGIKESYLHAASYLGLKWTEIPALSDVPLKSRSTPWPCMLFSHGLGGTRNAYSQVTGSIAASGLVVMAIEHRDNSAAISVVKHEDGSEEIVDYISIKESTPANIKKRRDQMAQRAYEMKLGLELFKSLNASDALLDLSKHANTALASFVSALDVKHGNFVIGGHSFGAATSVHVCKDSTTRLSSDPQDYNFSTAFRASILLDVWTEVLIDSNSRPLHIPSLCIASQAFYDWKANFSAVRSLLLSDDRNLVCWIKESAHLSQSDFGILFPLATRYAFKAQIDPHRAMDLNVRAVREFLRRNGVGQQTPDEEIFVNESAVVVVSS